MFDVINKYEYFSAMQDKTVWDFLRTSPHDLKRVQDAYIFNLLKDADGLTILEAGGGNSRLLRSFSRSNEMWNLDEFKGRDGGPANIVEIPGVRTTLGRLGDFSAELPLGHFDVVFSVSVVEHLPTYESISVFFRDGARLLKPGGMMYHAIDMYLQDEPFEYSSQRVRLYLDLAEQDGLRFLESPRIGPDIRFHCSYASNPDLGMFSWNNAVPSLAELRLNAQSVSLKMALRKKG